MPAVSQTRARVLRWVLLASVAAAFALPAVHANAATAPVNLSVPTVSGTLLVGKALAATPGKWSGTPSPTYAYLWQRCTVSTGTCADLSGSTKALYTLALADKGKQMRVRVTAKNAAGSRIAYSIKTPVINQLAPPSNVGPPAITGTAVDGATLTVTSGSWLGYPAPTYTYKWQRCVLTVCNATGVTTTTYNVTSVDVGKSMNVVVAAVNSVGSATATSARTAVVAALPPVNITAPTVVGTPAAGTALSSSPGEWSGTPPFTFTYQWRRCDSTGSSCVDIAGAKDSTYWATPSDIGATLLVVVTTNNPSGVPVVVASAPSAVVVNGPNPPYNSVTPTIDLAAPIDGDVVTVTSEWQGAASVTRQWQSCDETGAACQDLPGETGTSYTTAVTDVGRTLSVRELASNGDGNAIAVSSSTAVVSPRAPSLDGTPPTVTGRAIVGATLSTAPGTWAGTPTITYAYSWETSVDAVTWSPVDGADSATYIIGSNDVDNWLRVVVTASNAAADVSSAVSQSIGRVAATGVLWGASDSWQDNGAYFDATEQATSRRLTMVREYHRFNYPWVSPREQSLVNTGHSLVVSLRAMNKTTTVPYADITSGAYDDFFVAGLGQLNALATPTYFIFQHEADGTTGKQSCTTTDDVTCGQQFIAAWRHVRALAKAAGYDRLSFVWTVTAYGFTATTNVRNQYYWPGADSVDWVGVDVYNGGWSGGFKTFCTTLAVSFNWLLGNHPGLPRLL